MNHLDLSPNIILKFREQRVSVLPRIIQHASTVPVSTRWEVLFRLSTAPFSETISRDVQEELKTVYRVSRLEELAPRYLGAGEDWGIVVTPRLGIWSRERIAFLEHWFVTRPDHWDCILDSVRQEWSLPFESVQLAVSPEHLESCFLHQRLSTRLVSFVYLGDWTHFAPVPGLSDSLKNFSVVFDQNSKDWWEEFCGLMAPIQSEPAGEGLLNQLRKGLVYCQKDGGVLNLYDKHGLAGHISWSLGSDAELLIPQCWQIHWIVLRRDLRGRGISKLLYAEASRKMNLAEISLVCAHVQSGNLSSLKALEALGAERVSENYRLT